MIRILLVEDNEMNRDMLSRRLIRRGYEIRIAVDGTQGLEMALGDPPDIILMDMSLPDVDGWETTRRMRAEAALREVPIIALTAHAMEGDRDKALAAGCSDYDTKPVDLERLIGRMNELLNQSPRQ
jgi:CheY-like chemotaxis protein